MTWAIPARAVLLLIPVLFMSGCLAAAAGAAAGYGAVEYQDGAYTVAMPATLDASWRAAQSALARAGATVLGQSRGKEEGTIRARFPDGADAEVTLGPGLSRDFTRVSVRFGLFGDESRSRDLAARIKESLS